jgi:hypothetical protein
MIGAPGLDRLWHLHPGRIAGGGFAEELPSMPAGQYQIFADIVDKDGFPWTLVGNVEVAQVEGKSLAGDDSAWSGSAVAAQGGDSTVSPLADGGRMVWWRATDPLKANVPMSFKFSVEDKDGNPAKDMEPYMGMAGHAEFVSTDMSVFAHVHPAGSVSMAAMELARTGQAGASGELQAGMAMPIPTSMPMSSAPLPPEVSFPYGFPRPGQYRIFVQIKRAGHIQTGVFDGRVQ